MSADDHDDRAGSPEGAPPPAPSPESAPPPESAPLTAPAASAGPPSAPPSDPGPSTAAAYAPPQQPPPAAWTDRILAPLRLLATGLAWLYAKGRVYFSQDPTFGTVAVPLLFLSAILFSRLPTTNYIFDEQEALLANPYVNGKQDLRFIDAIHRDFWGLPPDRSVGSYRPLPNFLWRLVWQVTKQPFVHHFYNVLLHAIAGTLIALFAWRVSRRRDLAYLSGFLFVGCAVLTEAVSGIVGIADVFGGLGAVSALLALALPGWAMPFGVFAALLFALFSKESGIVCVPLVPFAALLVAPLLHPERPSRVLRAVGAAIASVAAFVLYVELRKRWFPSPLPAELKEELPATASRLKHLSHDFLVWFHQAPLPKDPLNNPLAEAPTDLRVAGALRVYARGVGQVLFPKTLSGDYSFPQEPAPEKTVFPESVIGALLMVVPLLAAVVFWVVALFRERAARGVARAAQLLARKEAAAEPGLVVAASSAAAVLSSAAEPAFASALSSVPVPSSGAMPSSTAGPSSAAAPSSTLVASSAAAPPPWMRPAGYALIALAVLPVLLHVFVLRDKTEGLAWNFPVPFWLSRSGNGAFWHAVPWSLALLPLGLAGLGFVAESGRPKVRPDAENTPVPLGRAGLLLAAIGLVWMVVSYFPHSNIPVILPTVRAERFWYFPAIGTSLVIAAAFAWLHGVVSQRRPRILFESAWVRTFLPAEGERFVVPVLFLAFFGFQCVQAYRHAMDYRNDLVFWEATRAAVPNSAKAHLNYSVMKGARGDLETRLVESKEAMRLAPEWPMAHIYTGDTLCRLHRPDEAWPYYKRGFAIGPNEQSLISLALQCMYDEKILQKYEPELRELAEAHPGSWIAYLAIDTLDNHEKHNGVDPKYRPRGYNEGPKD